jgi:polysaccharide export outer membrane protein
MFRRTSNMPTHRRHAGSIAVTAMLVAATVSGCQVGPPARNAAARMNKMAVKAPRPAAVDFAHDNAPVPPPSKAARSAVQLASHEELRIEPEPAPLNFPHRPLVPRELAKTVLPDYRIEPPDILQIDAIHIVPRSPYRLRTLDTIVVLVPGALPDAPIDGVFPIEPGGSINLGRPYGTVNISGKTIDEAREAIEKQLGKHLKETQATVSLGEIAAKQQISGPHLVGPDGAVTLGGYGKVSVVGLTVAQAKAAVEKHLAATLEEPEVSIDIYSYNSKVFYVVTQGAGLGDGVTRFAVTGNETVLDAISLINGLSPNSSTKIWVARPGRTSEGCHQILPVDWPALTQCGDTQTNYQLLPGDRVYVAEDRLIAMDTWIGKVIAPVERIAGFISLGTSTVSSLRFFHRGGQGGGLGGGF